MRYLGLTLVSVVLGAMTATAQQPPASATQPAQQPAPATALDPARNKLDALLLRWEKEMTTIQTIVAQCTRTSVDKTFQRKEIYEGTAKYMKPNFAMLEMQNKGKPQIFEKYVCTGTYLYEYVPQEKVIRVHELPTPKPGQVADDNFLSFLFGMRAEEAKRRYELKLVKGPPEDQWYYYVEILPRFPADKADFARARLVLNAQTFLPRELWFEQPNGDEVKWDIPKVEAGAALNRADFTSPTTPPGWSMARAPKAVEGAPRSNVPPRVVRPKF
jgi:TIGR03009 family protein